MKDYHTVKTSDGWLYVDFRTSEAREALMLAMDLVFSMRERGREWLWAWPVAGREEHRWPKTDHSLIFFDTEQDVRALGLEVNDVLHHSVWAPAPWSSLRTEGGNDVCHDPA